MMESAMEMEFLHKYLSDDWSVAGYSVTGDVHHVLLRSSTEMRALSFKTEDKSGNWNAEVVGFEDSVFIVWHRLAWKVIHNVVPALRRGVGLSAARRWIEV